MGASSQGGQMNPQGAQIRPQGQSNIPEYAKSYVNNMQNGANTQQGKGPGLPMPQQPQMGGNRPYQPVGANNGRFDQDQFHHGNMNGNLSSLASLIQQPGQQPNQGKGPQSPFAGPGQPMGSNMMTGYGGLNSVMQQPQTYQDYLKSMGPIQVVPQTEAQWNASRNTPPQMQQGMQQPNQGKGPQSPFAQPAQTGPVQPGMYSPIYGQQNTPGSMQ